MPDEKKVFDLDTNVLIQDPEAVEKFGDNDVLVHICVIQELDKLKSDQRDRNAQSKSRQASNNIAKYGDAASLQKGVPKQGGGRLYVDIEPIKFAEHPIALEESNDSRIILAGYRWQKKHGRPVVVKSNDLNVRIIASAIGLETEAYTFQKSSSATDESFTGIMTLPLIREGAYDIFRQLHEQESVPVEKVFEALEQPPENLYPNHCCYLVRPTGQTLLAIYKKADGVFRYVPKPTPKGTERGICPINNEQAFACALLEDPQILIVTLKGATGSGKTLLPLVAGYEQLEELYDQLVIYRPTFELGNQLGFLPGDISEKFGPWTLPILDNFDLMLEKRRGVSACQQNSKWKKSDRDTETKAALTSMGDFIRAGLLRITPINYEQGRTIHKSFVLADEVQNIDHADTKILIARMGEGTKIVLVGDVHQIVNPYCHPTSNGLWDTIEAFRGQEVYGHITLVKTERSLLAELADQLL